MHRKVDKVIEEIEYLKIMKKRNDGFQQKQLDHVVTDMKGVNVDTGIHTMKVLHLLIADALSQLRTEHRHRKIVVILDVAVTFFHAHMEDTIYAHRPAESDCTVVWLLLKSSFWSRKSRTMVARVLVQ